MASGCKPGENHNGGRKIKSLSEHKSFVSPAERKRRQAAENKLKSLSDIDVEPPAYLDDLAKQTWMRILPELKKLPLKFLDQSTFEQFCTFYSIYIQASEDIRANGIKTTDGNRKNPSYQIMSDAAKSMRQCGTELGFNFSSRMSMLINNNDSNTDSNTDKDADTPFASGFFSDINA